MTPSRGASRGDWVEFLRAAHPRDTAKHVAARLGVSTRTVQKWLLHERRPDFAAALALIDAYGPELLAIWLPAAWCADAARQARRARIEADMAALDAVLAALDP